MQGKWIKFKENHYFWGARSLRSLAYFIQACHCPGGGAGGGGGSLADKCATHPCSNTPQKWTLNGILRHIKFAPLNGVTVTPVKHNLNGVIMGVTYPKWRTLLWYTVQYPKWRTLLWYTLQYPKRRILCIWYTVQYPKYHYQWGDAHDRELNIK